MIKNNKGAASFGVILATLIATSLVILMFLPYFFNLSKVQHEESLTNTAYTNNMNSLERLHGYFAKNISHNTNLIFQDLGKNYVLKEISEDKVKMRSTSNSIFLNNRSSIEVRATASKINEDKAMSYGIAVYYKGNIVKKASSTSNSLTFYIDESFSYNEEKEEINYGDYSIKIIDIDNANVNHEVFYYNINSRIVNVSGDNFNQNLKIKNLYQLNKNEMEFLK